MLYWLAHILRDKFSWLWNAIELVNSVIFSLRYGKQLKRFSFSYVPEGYLILDIKDIPSESLVDFFKHQPDDAFIYFRPHGFDNKDIKRLQSNKSFLGYVLLDKKSKEIAGYCFLRCFFHGQGFRGRMVDIDYRGQGLGIAMNTILNEIGFAIGLRIFESVSKDNVSSYRSALSASKIKVVKEMPNNELYLEIVKD